MKLPGPPELWIRPKPKPGEWDLLPHPAVLFAALLASKFGGEISPSGAGPADSEPNAATTEVKSE